MALTSQQKHYIKKNVKKLSPEQMSYDLNLSSKEVRKYIDKHWPKIKVKGTAFKAEALASFSWSTFIKENINIFVLLFLLVAASYANSLGNAFVSDDIATIQKNPDTGNFSAIIKASPYMIGLLHSILDLFVYKIFGLSPAPYRVVNILFHLGSTWIIYIIIHLQSRKKIVALITASLFAVHPLLVESVTWISGAPYSLYGFFALLSFLFYTLSTNNKKLFYFSIASFIFALFSSNKVIFFPFALILYEICLGNMKYNWKKITAFLVIDSVVILSSVAQIGARIQSLNNDFYQDSSNMDNIFVKAPVAITTYLKLMVWPAALSLYQTEMNFSPLQLTIRIAVFIIFLGIIFWGWKKNRLIFFWLSFMIASLATSLTPFKIAWVVAERYIYLGSVGVFFVFSLFYVWLMEKGGEKYKYVFYGVLVLIVISLSARTIVRNVDWKNEDNLWIATAKVSPSGAPIHNNLGDVYARRKDYPKAVEEFTKATQINPGYADAYHNLANTYQMMGNVAEAEKYYTKALSINPRIWQSHQNLAAIYFEQGNKQKALESIQKAIALNPNEPGLQANLKIIQGEAPVPIGAPTAPTP